MAENENGNKLSLEAQFRENFSAQWNNADTEDKKKSLLRRILQMIKDGATSANTAVNEAKKENSGAVPPRAKDAKESAAQPIIEFLQFLSGNNGQPLDQEALRSLNLSDTQVSFLQTLAKTRHNADSATFIAQIVDKAISDPNYLSVSNKPGEQSQLEKDIRQAKLNETAENSLRESIKALAQEGKLKDEEGKNVTEDNVNQKLNIQDATDTQQRNVQQENTQQQNIEQEEEDEIDFPTDPRRMQGGRGRRRGGVEDPVRVAKYREVMDKLKFGADKETFNQLEADLEENRREVEEVQNSNTLSNEEREKKLQELTGIQQDLESQLSMHSAQINAALDFLVSGEVNEPFTTAQEVKNFIQARLNNRDENYFEQVRQFMREGVGTLDGSYEGYQDLAFKVNADYTADRIAERVIIDGRINIDAVQRLQADIEDDIGVLFETLYNSPKGSFEESFSSYSEGQMLRKITQHLRVQINHIIEDVKGKNPQEEKAKRDKFKQIFNDMIISPIQRRPALERIVHQYQQVGATIDLEKLRDILKTYNITSLQEFYNDDLTATINNLMPSFVQHIFIQNGNEMISNFFQLVQEEEPINTKLVFDTEKVERKSKKFVLKYREECIDYMYKVINAANRAEGKTEEVSRERINARFSRAYLDNFLLTLRGIKVMSKAKPIFEAFGDLPFDKLLTGVFNPLQGWGKFGHRGRGNQESGDAETTEFTAMNNFAFNEIAYNEYKKKHGDVFDDFHPIEMKKEGDKKLMFQVYPDNKRLMQDLRSGYWDTFYDMDSIYRGMVFGNIIDQSGWPFDGFKNNTIKRLSHDYMKDENGNPIEFENLTRKQRQELKYRTSGVITAFWDVGGDANDDTTNMFVRNLYRSAISSEIHNRQRELNRALTKEEQDEIKKEVVKRKEKDYNSMDWNKLLGEYTKGDKRFDKIFNVTAEGKQTSVAFREYRMHRVNSLKGEVFHQLLLKDPNAWLAEMVQTYPELSSGTVSYTNNNGISTEIKASTFYFDLDQLPDSAISKDDKVKRDRFRYQILTRFRGKAESDYLSNVPHLKKIMDFYAALYEKGAESNQSKDQALLNLSTNLSIGRQIAVDKAQASINPATIEDQTIRELMYGGNGLVTYFENMVGRTDEEKERYFGDGEANLGEINGFYQRWSFSKEQDNHSNILPEGDTNMKYLLEDNENPQALERRLGTDMSFVKAQEVLNKVPGVCKKAADADNFDSWYSAIEELHSEMAVIADEDQGVEQKYQQLLYQTICNWFSIDSDTEKMFIGALEQMKLGTDISLATFKSNNMTKFLLDQDNRRQYLNRLRDKSYIKGNYDAIGGWGFDTAELVAGVDIGEIFRKQAIYAMVGAILVTIGTAIKEGYEEQVEEDS